MKPNVSRLVDSESATAVKHNRARHCLVLALVGLAAIAVAIMLPRDEPARPAAERTAQAPELASQAGVGNVRLPGAANVNTIDPVDMPFDYFPAQFPMPLGEVGEQPPTF